MVHRCRSDNCLTTAVIFRFIPLLLLIFFQTSSTDAAAGGGGGRQKESDGDKEGKQESSTAEGSTGLPKSVHTTADEKRGKDVVESKSSKKVAEISITTAAATKPSTSVTGKKKKKKQKEKTKPSGPTSFSSPSPMNPPAAAPVVLTHGGGGGEQPVGTIHHQGKGTEEEKGRLLLLPRGGDSKDKGKGKATTTTATTLDKGKGKEGEGRVEELLQQLSRLHDEDEAAAKINLAEKGKGKVAEKGDDDQRVPPSRTRDAVLKAFLAGARLGLPVEVTRAMADELGAALALLPDTDETALLYITIEVIAAKDFLDAEDSAFCYTAIFHTTVLPPPQGGPYGRHIGRLNIEFDC
jgi:hypothetical protein